MKHVSYKLIVSFVFAMLSLGQITSAQSFLSPAEFHQSLALYSPKLGDDSLPHIAQKKLLPDNISFMERTLWGEKGIFRSIGIASPLTPESRKSELAVRRTMLTAHQIGGYITLALMGATVYYGQKTLNGSSDPAEYRRLRNNHENFVTATIIAYGATAMLSVLAPPPLIRRDESSTTTIHKTLAWVHFAGMILTPIIGSMIEHSSNYDNAARFHQYSAYITTAVFATSMIVMTF